MSRFQNIFCQFDHLQQFYDFLFWQDLFQRLQCPNHSDQVSEVHFFTFYNFIFLLLKKRHANVHVFQSPLSPNVHLSSVSLTFISIFIYRVDRGRGQRRFSGERAFVSCQCNLSSSPGVDTLYGLSLSLILFSAPKGSCTSYPVFHSPQETTFPISSSM